MNNQTEQTKKPRGRPRKNVIPTVDKYQAISVDFLDYMERSQKASNLAEEFVLTRNITRPVYFLNYVHSNEIILKESQTDQGMINVLSHAIFIEEEMPKSMEDVRVIFESITVTKKEDDTLLDEFKYTLPILLIGSFGLYAILSYTNNSFNFYYWSKPDVALFVVYISVFVASIVFYIIQQQLYKAISPANSKKDPEIRQQEIKESDEIEYQLQVMRNNSDYSIEQIEKYKKHMKEYKEYMKNLYN